MNLAPGLYRADLAELDEAGFLKKSLLVDLLDIEDPYDLDLDGDQQFSFSYKTIEGLLVINRTTLGIVNDNNYPFGRAAAKTGTQPDNNVFILLQVAPLWD